MKESGMLFSAPMVRALLNGSKTQTRRVLTIQPKDGWDIEQPARLGRITSPHPKRGKLGVFVRRGLDMDFPEADLIPCPYGQPSDRIWVRESWSAARGWDNSKPSDICHNSPVRFPADGATINADAWGEDETREYGKLRLSMFMPRWASRIDLEITGVRVERLQDISEADAAAEGIAPNWIGSDLTGWNPEDHGYLPHDTDDEGNVPGVDIYDDCWTAKRCYQRLWESINGSDSWAANPWVWVIEFKRL